MSQKLCVQSLSIRSPLQGSFATETYYFKEPTNHSHPKVGTRHRCTCTHAQCALNAGAICCSVQQGVAGCCSVLQCVAVCCSVLHLDPPLSHTRWCAQFPIALFQGLFTLLYGLPRQYMGETRHESAGIISVAHKKARGSDRILLIMPKSHPTDHGAWRREL